mgnify:FL=1
MSENALELRHVSRRLGDFELRDVNLTLPKGCILGLVGENGAGKSTTIRLLTGELRPDSGTVSVLDAEPGGPDFRAVKERLGVVLDDAWFPEILNARQVGTMMAMTYESWDAELYESYLTRFTLPREKNFKDYSRGMRMKLAIAAALAHRPEVLLLDEATAGLDPIVRDEVLEIFREFSEAEDHAILISSHILSDLEKLCDYIAFLHQGKLLFCQEKDRLLETYGLFVGTRQQAEELAEDAVLAREDSGFGGVRAIVRRDAVPACLPLEKPTVEDIILAMVRKEQKR